MKNKILPLLFLGIIFIAGCVLLGVKLELKSPQQDGFAKENNYELKFEVINPTTITFVGIVEYSYNGTCLKTDRNKDEIEIDPRKEKLVIKRFSSPQYRLSQYGSRPENYDGCLDTPHRINVLLRDKGGEKKDTFDVSLIIT